MDWRTGNSMNLKTIAAVAGIFMALLCEKAYAEGQGLSQASASTSLTVTAIVRGRCSVSTTDVVPVTCGPGQGGRSPTRANWTYTPEPVDERDNETPAAVVLEVYF